jgi:NADP-dependent 3-hydroxy acid dehydrogenase YdfG
MGRRIALVTGASGGIGEACAEVLSERGYELLLTARREEPLRALAERLGGRYVVGDSADERDVERVAAAVDRIDVLVHAAGIMQGTYVAEQPVETFDRVVRTNLRSSYLVTKAALAKMGAGGRIVYISSTAGLKGMPGLTAYSASKAGTNALAQAVAGEVEHLGINVHIVVPAPVDTPMLDDVAHAMHALQPADVADVVRWLDALPPRVVIREIVMRSVVKGPFATEMRKGGGTQSPATPLGSVGENPTHSI